jgi:hypothetical protein
MYSFNYVRAIPLSKRKDSQPKNPPSSISTTFPGYYQVHCFEGKQICLVFDKGFDY